MKNTIFILLVTLSARLNGQMILKAIELKRNHDTLDVIGYSENEKNGRKTYLIKDKRMSYEVQPEKIKLLDNHLTFWQRVAFEFCGYKINTRGWELNMRNRINGLNMRTISILEQNGQLFNAPYAQDYLQSLLNRIHPDEMFKGKSFSFCVYILNFDSAALYAFDNGVIFITTQLLANIRDEDELLKIMASGVAAVVTDLQFDAFNKKLKENTLKGLPTIDEELSMLDLALVPIQTDNKLKKVVTTFYEKWQTENRHALSKAEVLEKISYIISYTAWQEYYSNRYKTALKLINLLSEYNLDTNEDLLLKAKIYLKLANTIESNREVLTILSEAEKKGPFILSDIYEEKGIVLLRLNQPEEAIKAFKQLEELLQQEKNNAGQLKWCRYMMHKCLLFISNQN